MAIRRILVTLVAFILFGLIIGPYLVPIPPLEDTQPHRDLADDDSQFVIIKGVDVHYKEQGGANKEVFLLLHGFGASIFTWQQVMKPLAEYGQVVAWDRPGFGITERPLPEESWLKGPASARQPGAEIWNPYSPQAQVDIALALLDNLGLENVTLIGNSAGGAVAAQIAVSHPDRVKRLILVSPALRVRAPNRGGLMRLMDLPQVNRLGPLLVRSISESGMATLKEAWHEPDQMGSQTILAYRRPLQAENWDRGLWEFTKASRARPALLPELQNSKLPMLIITGDDDRIVPTSNSVEIADLLKTAGTDVELAVIPACGHVPQEECPLAFMEVVNTWVQNH